MVLRRLLLISVPVLALISVPSAAHADLIQLTNVQLTGQGIGAVLTALTLQNGQPTTESGRVEFINGAFGPTGDASTGSSQWHTFNFGALGISNANQLGLIVNLAEPGSENPPSVTTTNPYLITLYAYTGSGSLLQSFVCTTCAQLNQVAGGVGGSGIVLGLTSPQATQLNTLVSVNPGYVLTVGASFANAQGGNDVIQAVRLESSTTTPVPEPTSLLLLGTGLSLAGRFVTKRK